MSKLFFVAAFMIGCGGVHVEETTQTSQQDTDLPATTVAAPADVVVTPAVTTTDVTAGESVTTPVVTETPVTAPTTTQPGQVAPTVVPQ